MSLRYRRSKAPVKVGPGQTESWKLLLNGWKLAWSGRGQRVPMPVRFLRATGPNVVDLKLPSAGDKNTVGTV